jgi:hypothetical protein
MALSAPTFIQPLAADHTRDAKVVVVDVTFDATYVDNGMAFSIAQLGLSEAWYVSIDQTAPVGTAVGAYVFQWDYTNKKIVAYWVDTTTDGLGLTEVPAGTSLSTVTARCFFYGLSS